MTTPCKTLALDLQFAAATMDEEGRQALMEFVDEVAALAVPNPDSGRRQAVAFACAELRKRF